MLELSFESRSRLSQADFASWIAKRPPNDENHYELLNGRVVMTPPAGFPHGLIGSQLQHALVGFVDSRALGHVFDASQGFELPSGDTVEPDHSFVSSERWSAMPPPIPGAFLRVVPDLIIEILSASTGPYDRGEKKAVYERNGVREYWLLDWRTRQISVFTLDGGKYDGGVVCGEDEVVRSGVLGGFELPLKQVLPSGAP